MVRIGSAYQASQDPLVKRVTRSTDDDSGGRRRKKKIRPFSFGPPMRNAPSGTEAALQRVLLAKPRRIERVPSLLLELGRALVNYVLRRELPLTAEPTKVARRTIPQGFPDSK